MKIKLRRIKLERRTFKPKHDREELQSIKIIHALMTEENRRKQLEAEEKALSLYLNPLKEGKLKEPKLDALFDMRYSDELTEYNTRFMNALEGRCFNETWNYDSYRNREKREHPERKYEVSKLSELLEALHELTKENEEALKIIEELKFRFKALKPKNTNKYESLSGYEFQSLLGRLLGTKFDWMGVRDGITILYDAKNRFYLNEKEAETYFNFSIAGIPFFLLIWDKNKKELRRYDMKRFDPKKMKRDHNDNFIIPREETDLIPIEEISEPS